MGRPEWDVGIAADERYEQEMRSKCTIRATGSHPMSGPEHHQTLVGKCGEICRKKGTWEKDWSV